MSTRTEIPPLSVDSVLGKAGDPVYVMSNEERLRAAIARVKAKGYSVVPGEYGVGWNAKRSRWSPRRGCGMRMSPLGALVVVEQPPVPTIQHQIDRYKAETIATGSVPAAAAKLLSVDMLWIIDFSLAFDALVDLGTDGAQVGVRLRREMQLTS